MYEVKSDGLEASFEALEQGHEVEALREEVAVLKAQVAAGAVTRPVLSGTTGSRCR